MPVSKQKNSESFAKSLNAIKVSEVGRNLIPDFWIADEAAKRITL